ncbi:MAG: response regulator [Balneola sp.]|mgnify:CR=1 FL=1|nr:response regulator [Balneola sp.]MBE79577.1 response regulator [Balneola sp.]|tara:strand:- start:269 stop:637 length:369 start_codon:yes stop_codon:yes gene_type:complete
MKIIIVEDDKVLSLLLSKMIQRLDYDVLEVITKGQEAIEKIEALNPDLILMDIMLEDDVDGIDAMLALREKSIDTPVIYITGNSDPLNRERAKSTNYVEYLIKPVGFDELKNTIASLNTTES